MNKHLVLKFIFFILLFAGFTSGLKASHIMGGELTYKYLDANGPSGTPFRYKIKFNIYSNCDQSSLYPTGIDYISFDIYNVATGATSSYYVNSTITDITPALPSGCQASGTTGLCIKLNQFETTVNLPSSLSGFYVIYRECCKNSAIVNLFDPGSAYTTFYTFIPASIYKNNSPQFTDLAVPYICVGDTTSILNSAIDPDGDKLIYSFVQPYDNFTPPSSPTGVAYNSGYNQTIPFGSAGYSFINASTGLTSYASPNTGNFVVAVEIKEYRTINGAQILLTTTRRELQIIVGNCSSSNVRPQFTNKIVEYNILAGDDICFNIGSTDFNNDSITMVAASRIIDGSSGYTGPLATYNPTKGKGNASSNFCWSTTCASPGTYTINASAKDNGCPPKTNNIIYTINVSPVNVPTIIGPDTLCAGSLSNLYYVVSDPNTTLNWTVNGGSITSSATNDSVYVNWGTSPGNKIISLKVITSGGCIATKSKNVFLKLSSGTIIASPKNFSLCSGDSVQLSVTGGTSYRWLPSAGLSDSLSSTPVASPLKSTVYKVVETTNPACPNIDSLSIVVHPKPIALPIHGSKSVCPNVTGVDYWTTAVSGSSYKWIVNGGVILSGQGTDSIKVNWGVSSDTAKVYLIPSNSYSCKGDTVILKVKIKIQLETEIPSGIDTLCINNGSSVNYQTVKTNGSTYTWKTAGVTSNILSGNGSNSVFVNWQSPGLGKIWIDKEENTTSSNYCVGASDTLLVNILPSPDSTIKIIGNMSICEFSSGSSYTLNGFAGSTYSWEILPATAGSFIAGDSTSTVVIDWAGVDTVIIRVQETTLNGCIGSFIDSTIIIHPIPHTSIANNNLFICPENTSSQLYFANGLNQSTYQWNISGGTIGGANNKDSIYVIWDMAAGIKTLSVLETSVFNCPGVLIPFPLVYDSSLVSMKVISDELDDDRLIKVEWESATLGDLYISRRPVVPSLGPWVNVGPVSNTASSYINGPLETGTHTYEYKVEGVNLCGHAITSLPHTNVLLKKVSQEENNIQMEWTAYAGWPVMQYEIWRKLDESNYVLYSTMDNHTFIAGFQNGIEGFHHCYRIKAINLTNNQIASWSNEICFDFEHPLFIPNLITVNGDELNDVFEIKNIQLYPNNHLAVYNGWGSTVYEKEGYNNEWAPGSKISDGIYYYTLKTRRDNKVYKGWVHIIK